MDRPALLYVLRVPVLKVDVAGARFFLAAVGEVSSKMELLRSARDHLPLLDKNEIEVGAQKSARLYDLLGSRLPSRAELRFAWFGFEVKEREPERRALVRFKVTLHDAVWRKRRTLRAETVMEAFTVEAWVVFDLARRERRAFLHAVAGGRWAPAMVAPLGHPFYNFNALKGMPAEPPVRFKVRKSRARTRGDADLRSYLA